MVASSVEVEVAASVVVEEDTVTQARTVDCQVQVQGIPVDFLAVDTGILHLVAVTDILHQEDYQGREVVTGILHQEAAMDIHHPAAATAIPQGDYQVEEQAENTHTHLVVAFLEEILKAITTLTEELAVHIQHIPLSTTTTTTHRPNKSATPPLDSDRFLTQSTMAHRRHTCINTKIQEVNTVLYWLVWRF